MFQGLLKYNNADFHSFSTEDIACSKLGIISYSLSSIKEYLSDPSIIQDAILIFKEKYNTDNVQSIISKITGDNDVNASYFHFNINTGLYEEKKYNNKLTDLIEAHDASQQTDVLNPAVEDKITIIKEIQQSLHGCIDFYPFGTESGKPKYKLHFQNRNKRNNIRDLAINGDPKISAIPRIPTGKKYHYDLTQKNKDVDNIGYYKTYNKSKFSLDPNDLTARVAAKLRLCYNEGLGYFESGTQIILARLLQDLDAAPLSEIDISNIDHLSSSDMYDPTSTYYVSQFTVGVALPMSVHNGNPFTFGPNIIDKESFKKEKIIVVNRAAKSFKQNDVVLCMLIDNEWIVQDFGEQTLEPPGIKLGKWWFNKMLVNSDSFLLDDRYYSSGQGGGYEQNIFGEAYATRMKVLFYRDLNNLFADPNLTLDNLNNINLLCKLNAAPSSLLKDIDLENIQFPENIDDVDFQPSTRYVQASSFDMVGYHMGGNNSLGNIIGRTNRTIPNGASAPSIAEYIRDIGLWWGPIFTEGYSSSKNLQIKDKEISVGYSGNLKFFGSSPTLNMSDASKDKNKSTTGSMFDEPFDFNFYQLPADIALNASPSGVNGSPIESISLLSKHERLDKNFAIAYNNFRFSDIRYSWIINSGDGSSFYDLEPITKTKLQFIPLAWEFPAAQSGTLPIISGANNPDAIWGNISARESELTTVIASGDGFLLPWDDKISQRPISRPYGVEYTFRDNDPRGSAYDGANLLAITACKNTIRIAGGASLQLDCSYSFGLPKWTSVTGGGSMMNIVPGGFGTFGIAGGGSAIQSFGFPQWGSSSTTLTDVWGGSTLRAKVYDHWPEEDTIYDVRYFQPLHFTAGKLGSIAKSKTVDTGIVADINQWIPSGESTSTLIGIKYERSVDEISYNIDFRVPTYGDPLNDQIDNTIVPSGQIINRRGVASDSSVESTIAILRDESEWRVNTICRGMMVNENFGFRYLKRTIGLNGLDYTVIDGGSGFKVGEKYENLTNGVSVEIVATDNGSLGFISLNILDAGKGFLPSNFNKGYPDPENEDNVVYGYPLKIGNATVLFHTGIVYDKLEETNYPKKQGEINCLPKSDGDGGVLYGSKSTTIGINTPNNSSLYDIFIFYANDVGHVDLVPQAQTAGFLQYVDLDIGAA